VGFEGRIPQKKWKTIASGLEKVKGANDGITLERVAVHKGSDGERKNGSPSLIKKHC